MAFFGLFGDDDDGQPQQRSFLGGIGNFLMKWVVAPIAIIATLGLIFKNETARNFIDGFTGGDGNGDRKGAASWLSNLFDKGVDMAGDGWDKLKGMFGFTPAPKAAQPTDILEVNGIKTLKPNSMQISNPIFEDKGELQDLANISAKLKSLNSATVSPEDGAKGRKDLNAKILSVAFPTGLALEQWNMDVVGTIGSAQEGRGAPKPPPISLKVAELTEDLAKYGATKFAGTWDKSTSLQRIQMLANSPIGLLGEDQDKLKSLDKIDLNPSAKNEVIRLVQNTQNITKLEQILPGITLTGNPNSFLTKNLSLDKELYEKSKQAIDTLFTEKRYSEAALIATQTRALLAEMVNKLPDGEKKRGAFYTQALTVMEGLKQETTELSLRKDFVPILDETVAGIFYAAKNAPVELGKYNQLIEEFAKKGVAPAPQPDTNISAEDTLKKALEADAAKKALEAKKDKKEGSTTGTTVDPDTQKQPSASLPNANAGKGTPSPAP